MAVHIPRSNQPDSQEWLSHQGKTLQGGAEREYRRSHRLSI